MYVCNEYVIVLSSTAQTAHTYVKWLFKSQKILFELTTSHIGGLVQDCSNFSTSSAIDMLTVTWYWFMMWLFDFMPALSFMYDKTSYPTLRFALGGRAERLQMVYANDKRSLIHQITFGRNQYPWAHPLHVIIWMVFHMMTHAPMTWAFEINCYFNG